MVCRHRKGPLTLSTSRRDRPVIRFFAFADSKSRVSFSATRSYRSTFLTGAGYGKRPRPLTGLEKVTRRTCNPLSPGLDAQPSCHPCLACQRGNTANDDRACTQKTDLTTFSRLCLSILFHHRITMYTHGACIWSTDRFPHNA